MKQRRKGGESICKPGSVEDDHSSRRTITHTLKRPTRIQYGPYLRIPIWSCFWWGLPCRELLPDTRCALTAPFHPYLIPLAWAIGGLLSVALVVGCYTPQALPGTLPYGARTFLPSARLPRKGRRRSGDCLVSFGAQYRGFARRCHPSADMPTCKVAAMLRDAR